MTANRTTGVLAPTQKPSAGVWPQTLRYRVHDIAPGLTPGDPVRAGTRLDTRAPGTLCALDGHITSIRSSGHSSGPASAPASATASAHAIGPQGSEPFELSIRVTADQGDPTRQALLPRIDPTSVSDSTQCRARLLDRIAHACIGGLGGGRYPTAAKLGAMPQCPVLIINAMQSEPDNHSDLWLVAHDPEGVAAGIALTALAANARDVRIGLPDHTDRSVGTRLASPLAAQFAALSGHQNWRGTSRLTYLPADAASGAETLLATSIADITTQLHQPLYKAGALSVNVGTAYAIGRAVLAGEPLLRRVVTIAGNPRWVWLGTPVSDLLPGDCVLNGQLAGETAPPNAAIHAGHFCLNPVNDQPTYACINCSACVPVCPAELRPDLLHAAWLTGSDAPEAIERLNQLSIERCIECGACNAVCPSRIELAQAFRTARRHCATQRDQAAAAERAKTRVAARTARLQRIEQDRAAARAARERAPRQW